VTDENGNSVFILRSTIPGYMTEWFWSALEVYCMTVNMECLPFGGGWAEQPSEISTIISVLKVEDSRIEKEEWDKKTTQKNGG